MNKAAERVSHADKTRGIDMTHSSGNARSDEMEPDMLVTPPEEKYGGGRRVSLGIAVAFITLVNLYCTPMHKCIILTRICSRGRMYTVTSLGTNPQ